MGNFFPLIEMYYFNILWSIIYRQKLKCGHSQVRSLLNLGPLGLFHFSRATFMPFSHTHMTFVMTHKHSHSYNLKHNSDSTQ